MTGLDLYNLGKPHVGEPYLFGAIVPKNRADYRGPWDCAEFASWLVYQLTKKLYGCANNNGDPAGADAYSGFWARDADLLGKKITIDEATRTPGAALIRLAGPGIIGHVAISNGTGGTVEAHSSRAGVAFKAVSGRRWDFGVLVPWIEYSELAPVNVVKPMGTIYRYVTPMMHDDKIKEIQKALGIPADGFYGPQTFNAVRSFQQKRGLVVDGEVGAHTADALHVVI